MFAVKRNRISSATKELSPDSNKTPIYHLSIIYPGVDPGLLIDPRLLSLLFLFFL
jgi:hypothetical protein